MIETDVLVVGGGIAAATAAVTAADSHARVVLLDKGKFGSSGSSLTSGAGISLLLPADRGGHPEDNASAFLHDTVIGGAYLNDQQAAQFLCEEGAACLRDLEEFGVRYKKDAAGKYVLKRVFGQSFPRSIQPIPQLGSVLTGALRKEALRRGVHVVEHTMAVRLLRGAEGVWGAVGLQVQTGEYIVIKSKATILAAGSATALYPYASANLRSTGDAYALAYDAGAELTNMEFVEFTVVPICDGRPISTGGVKQAIAAGAKWSNASGEFFMQRYDPQRLDFANRATMVQANYLERRAGRGPVYLDFLQIPPARLSQLEEQDRQVLPKLRAAGIDYRSERVEFAPAVNTFLGGARADPVGQTNVAGLYAAGEAAGFAGAFGADRSGSAILACLVSGKHAGRSAAAFALDAPELDNLEGQIRAATESIRELRDVDGDDPLHVRRHVEDAAWKHLNAVRDGVGLREAIQEFAYLRQRRFAVKDARQMVAAIEARNLALTGEMVARAALLREESRGQHLREDFGFTDNLRWLKWIVIGQDDGEMNLQVVDVPLEDYPLQPAREKVPHPVFQAVGSVK